MSLQGTCKLHFKTDTVHPEQSFFNPENPIHFTDFQTHISLGVKCAAGIFPF